MATSGTLLRTLVTHHLSAVFLTREFRMRLTPPPKSRSALAPLEISVSAEGAATVIALRGEADIATLPQVMAALDLVIDDREGDVIVDMAENEFIDTATLRAVLRAKEVLDGRGRRLTFRSPSRTASRLLAICEVSHLVGDEPRARG